LKKYVFLFLSIFITSLAFAQEVLLTVDNYEKYDLNIISNEVNIFVDDSVYVFNNKGVTSSKSNRFNELDINQINDSIFRNPGGGSIYKMDSKHQFKRILHKPRMEQSFFGSLSFVRNDTVFQYGGYGNFSYKNDLIFVDSNLGTWEYYPYTQKNKLKPSVGTPLYYTFFDSTLIIAGIFTESSEGSQVDHIILNEVWEFSFGQKIWKLRGHYDFIDQFKGSMRIIFDAGDHYFANTLFNTYLTIDLKNNIWTEYQAMSSLQNSIRAIKKLNNYYYLVNQKSGKSIQLLRVSNNQLLSKKIQEGKILADKTSTLLIISILIVCLILCTFFLIYIRKSKVNNITRLSNFKTSCHHLLSANEILLIDDLISNYPSGVSYKNISSYFDVNLNYETVKLKTRKLIHGLNEKIKQLNNNEDLILVGKSNEDKRARIVYIKTRKRST